MKMAFNVLKASWLIQKVMPFIQTTNQGRRSDFKNGEAWQRGIFSVMAHIKC